MDLRPQGSRRPFFLREERGRHDDVGVDRDERHSEALADEPTPALGLAERILVTDD